MPRKFYRKIIDTGVHAIAFELAAPEGFAEITEATEIKTLYIEQYELRINDGKEYVIDFTADTYINVINGTYTEAEAFELEAHIKDLYSELNNGWWLTAQNTNTNLALLGIYTQIMKDEIQLILDTYVSENY